MVGIFWSIFLLEQRIRGLDYVSAVSRISQSVRTVRADVFTDGCGFSGRRSRHPDQADM